jgi:hypothetical protein
VRGAVWRHCESEFSLGAHCPDSSNNMSVVDTIRFCCLIVLFDISLTLAILLAITHEKILRAENICQPQDESGRD